MPTIATVIATLNEEIHIERSVLSAKSLGPVYVVDAGSSDATVPIAEAASASVLVHPWEGYSAQKNWAREQVPRSIDWILHLDADEYLTPILRLEIARAVAGNTAPGFYIARQNVFLHKVLRHAWWYPDYQLRLFKRDSGRYEDRRVHEHVLLEGTPGFLRHPLMHENLKGIDQFINRHLHYAGLEATEILASRQANSTRRLRTGRWFGSWPDRRRALKTGVWYRVRGRPILRFLWLYVVKKGYRDGGQGLAYTQLIAAYEAMIDAKVIERTVRAEKEPDRTFADPRGLVVCPHCHGELTWNEQSISCHGCSSEYPVVDGIPVLIPDNGDRGGSTSERDHRQGQAAFFDVGEAPPEFEMTRPRETARLYRWMLNRKFRNAVDSIEECLPGATAVAVCGGSGLDSDYLAEAGAGVITADISLGAAKRAADRAQRFSLPIFSIVADAQCLPFRTGSVDVTFVHDGLHHLRDPLVGVSEMARVAGCAVSISEPARAAITSMAVKVGIAVTREEAGNRVARLSTAEIARTLEASGFTIASRRRYALFYRHEPQTMMRVFSIPGLFAMARFIWCAIDRTVGRFGNKLAVQARRT